MKILIVDDDLELALTVQDSLKNYFAVDLAFDGEDGEFQAYVNDYDLIVLDYMLPNMDGVEVCERLREHGITTPILMVTGKNEITDKVIALNSGIDDYITKPFHIDELIARIRALLRRSPQVTTPSILHVGDLVIDITAMKVKRGGKWIVLRRKEFYILEYLARNLGRVITRGMLLEHAWESCAVTDTNTVDVHIKNLRNQIDRGFKRKIIKTIRGVGYQLVS